MNSTAIFLVLLSATFHALSNFLHKQSGDKVIFLWITAWISTAFLIPASLISWLNGGEVSSTGVILGLVSGLIHAFYFFWLSKSYESGDLSHVYPIIRSAPAPVLLFSLLFLSESVTLWGVLGILIVTFGAYAINLNAFSARSFLEPLRGLTSEPATRYAFLTLFTVVAYSIVDKLGVDNGDPIIYFAILMSSGAILYTPAVLKSKPLSEIQIEWQLNAKSLLITAVLSMSSYALLLTALTLERVSYVVGLRQISVVIAVVLGGRLLMEENWRVRLAAALLIFLGSLLISFA